MGRPRPACSEHLGSTLEQHGTYPSSYKTSRKRYNPAEDPGSLETIVQLMPLLVGQHISPEELERTTSTWPPERFAALCNTVIWAASGRAFQEFPSFTTRVNVKDGGIDAEWTIEIPDDHGDIPTPILRPGWNVFQYKKRDVLADKRQPIITRLRSSLVGALKEIEENFGRKPERYVLFVNIHLTPGETASLKKSIQQNDGEDLAAHIQVVGAAELAALLNDHPHLRAAFFTPLAFQTWQGAYEVHRNKKRFGSSVEIVGRESELDRLKTLVDSPLIRAIVLSGPHDMGKSRLALEATKHKPYDVAVAIDPRSTDLANYRDLCSNRSETICIVEDPEFDTLQSLIGEALSVPGLKLLITYPAAEASDLSYGFDNRVESLQLFPLGDESARELLHATGQVLDYGIQEWILSQAGGIPGILLAAASIASNLRQDHTAFSTAVGKEFERRIVQELGEAASRSARLLAVLTHVGISGPHEAEIQTICEIFGDGLSSHEVLAQLPKLENSGLARRAGYFAEIALPLLANHLIEQLLQGRRDEMFALFARLDEAGQIRFIKRLAQLRGPEAEPFWNELFASDGLLGTLPSILKRPHLLRLVAGTVPHRVLHVLESNLLTSTRETRLAIAGRSRRELMWALEQLLFRAKTSKGALRLIWLLAEAENESWANNATGVLEECFLPRHPQMPLPLDERAALIRQRLSSRPKPETRLVAIKAIEKGLGRERLSVRLRRSESFHPLDTRPDLTWPDVSSYLITLAEILISLASQEDETSQAALKLLPNSLAELAYHGLTAKSQKYFKLLTHWARSERKGLDVSKLSGVMRRVRDFYDEQLAKRGFPDERKAEYTQFISALTQWQVSLDQGGFATRLKLWAGGGRYRLPNEWNQVEQELRKLAQETVQSPVLLTTDLTEWLTTSSMRETRSFFYALGQEDNTLYFQRIVEALGKDAPGSNTFAPYFAGWANRDPLGAENRLDELADSHSVSATALLGTTSWLDPTPRGLTRIKKLASGDPEYAAAILGRWIDHLSPREFTELLQIIGGHDLQQASAAVDLLGSWMYHQKPFDGPLSDLAWRCIEHGPSRKPARSAEGWHFDELASKLTEANPDVGFEKFHQLLIASPSRTSDWELLDMDGGNQWWKTLRAQDRLRVFRILLATSLADHTVQEMLSWRLKDLLDQEQDADDLLKAIGDEAGLARIAARWLVGSKPNFWTLAFALLKRFPHNPQLQSALTSAAMDIGTMIEGPGSRFYTIRQQEIQALVESSSTPTEARPWLRDLIEILGSEVETRLIWEYDLEVNDVKRYIHGDDIDQKRWAIGRVLKYAQWSDVRKLLTVDEIEEALPHITLPEPRRTIIARLLPTWKHAS